MSEREPETCLCGWPERDCVIRAWGNRPEDNLHLPCAERDAEQQATADEP